MGPTGQTPGPVTVIAGMRTSAAPTLAVETGTNQLLAGWQDASTSHLSVAQSPDGTMWPLLLATPPTSHKAPDLMAIGTPPEGMSPYYWTWISASNNQTIYLKQGATLSDWQPSPQLRENSPFAPSLGYVGQPHEVMVAMARR
ncbi:MAG TPA: hypothetical protein VGP82_15125, partial [Ktedonobacterales bacterium]|nr:hypothetical protein [Ktedonobacterales bacterium]